MNMRSLGWTLLLPTACIGLAGCVHSRVSLVERDAPYKDIDVKQPDFIMVGKAAVTPEQARKLATLRLQSSSEHIPTADEQRLGNALAGALQTELVKAINKAGIQAHPEGNSPEESFKTGVFAGYFLQGTAGSSTGSVGFQLIKDHFRLRVVFNIREVPINGVTVDMHTRLRTGMSDEKIQRIASEEAEVVADRLVDELLVPAYKRRGWLD